MPFTMTRRSGMASEARDRDDANLISRRVLIRTAGIAAGAAALAPRIAGAQAPAPMAPPSTITTPPRDFGPNAPPNVYFTDPDVLTIDPIFNGLRQPNAPIQRLWTGALWSEGPAWSGQGRYLVWSDIPNNRQMRWLEDNGRVTVFRMPSNNSNGNTFDFQGRQLSCEHLTRRVVRYEHDGSITVIADRFEGKRLNSPNDVVPHPDGSYWFTDPPYGGQLYEGAGDTGPGGKGEMYSFDVGTNNKVSNRKLFSDFMIDSVKCGPDGVRCDVDGNLWCSSNAGRAVGYSGVTVWTPEGKLIGRIRLPEICGNICFGGPKRNRLFMAASQSLYALYVATQGASPG